MLSGPYHFKFFKGCIPQILLNPFLNTFMSLFLEVPLLSGKTIEILASSEIMPFDKLSFIAFEKG